MEPESAGNSLLWIMEEIGEVIAIIKKRGEKDIENDKGLKEAFTEELVDVFMYFLDILNRYGINGEEFSEAFVKKNDKNHWSLLRKALIRAGKMSYIAGTLHASSF
ncbi:MAG: hypothetical protein LBK61_11530 [Spirochaetaceae bacterium]|jgi:NTP pyrophosphatase (non-canonical NTP hydrolase)|nr:hypothetical protein [Spirochaetaceae bacterium]